MTTDTPDYRGFARAITNEGWPAYTDIEASTLFDLCKEFDLVREIPGGFDPEQHNDDGMGIEKGDPWYEFHEDLRTKE